MICRHEPEAVRARLHDAVRLEAWSQPANGRQKAKAAAERQQPIHGRKLKVHVSALDGHGSDIDRAAAPACPSQSAGADDPKDRYLFDQPSPSPGEQCNVKQPLASLLQGIANPMMSRAPGPEATSVQALPTGLQPSSTTTQLIVDLLTDDDDGADTCAIPALGFGFAPSSSSSASSSLGGSGEMMQGILGSHSTISVGNVGAADAAALGLALGRLMPTQSAEEVEFALQALMLLPPKQRKMCLFNPAWLKVKVKAALVLLQAEPTGVSDRHD